MDHPGDQGPAARTGEGHGPASHPGCVPTDAHLALGALGRDRLQTTLQQGAADDVELILEMDVLATTRARTYLDRSPDRASRTGWRRRELEDDVKQGDVFLLSDLVPAER